MIEDHVNITIKGRVQGVGFRFSAVRMARSLGINGYIKNCPDGSVFIEAEGKKKHLDKFISWCYTGPTHAWVDDVIVDKSNFKNFNGFDARI
jgi:acylphosphatase